MTASTSSHLHSDSVQRALDHYFNPAPEHSPGLKDMQLVVARDDLSPQAAAEQAIWLLRCASSTAYEAAQHLRDKTQDQVLVSMHLINLARAMLDRSHSQVRKDEENAGKK
ncbi:hypothetical protein [Pseudomonas putida]|uniref:DUF3077 domain-containing protein n=1 Tax=Pseudomonas putida TaxID=303 RepID=A0A1Q9R663_PSEPU|nr:hypothetical protein [Pseudomonas putida]OLS62871.1 hypothetical protein PSEMO_22250 [Pseudomonas putida]